MENTANRRLWIATFVISLSSFLFGFGLSALNAALKDKVHAPGSILWDIDLSKQLQQVIHLKITLCIKISFQVATAMTIIGAWLGSLLSGFPAEPLGLRQVLLLNNVFFIVGIGL